jgi:hypothetical protein
MALARVFGVTRQPLRSNTMHFLGRLTARLAGYGTNGVPDPLYIDQVSA